MNWVPLMASYGEFVVLFTEVVADIVDVDRG